MPAPRLCPLCEEGTLGIFRCADGRALVVMCDECNAVWLDPEKTALEDALIPVGPDLTVPGTTCALIGPRAGWATAEEITARGWSEAGGLRHGSAR